jgi:hypothetical protein
MSLKTFFNNIFLKNNTIIDILNLYSNPSDKGFKFERCADLLIKLGFFPIFSNDKYKHVIGNINEGKIHFLTDIKSYIDKEKENSGNKNGISDITLYNEFEDKFIFISSKFYSKESNVKNYDIQDIKAMIDHNKYLYKNYEIYLLVNDKDDLIEKVLNSNKSSNYITKYMNTDNIIDLKDLEKAFDAMKKYLDNGSYIFDNFIFKKKTLIHKFHQKLFEIKFFKQRALNNNKFLFGLKPRSGKTFLVGFIISNDKKNYEDFNILIITPAPNETSSQFLNMFNEYSEFNEFNIIHLNSGNMIKDLKFTNKNIIVTSKQLLQNYINENGILSIKNLNFNYIFFDENHYGGTTTLSKSIVNTYKSINTTLVFLTATFHKTINHWNILEDCSFYWDLEDEELCKNQNIKSLIFKHGDEVLLTLNYFNNELDILTEYKKMPVFELITTMFETSIFNNIKEELKHNDNNKYGFSLKTLFSISNSSFKYEKEVELLLRYISGSKKHIDFPEGDKSIFGRIVDISTKKNSRTTLSNGNFTTQLWFLPFGIEQKINDVSQNLKKLILNDMVLKHYEILVLNSNIDTPIKDIKDEIKKQELLGKDNGKTGLIVLVGNQCSLGITLELCDTVILLNDIISSDKIYQMMYRCMTEAYNKKCGFVVDLNINRVLNTIMDYQLNDLLKKDLNTENKIKYIIENNLINIDSDYLLNKRVDNDVIIHNLLEIWKKDPINGLRRLLKNIEDEILEISNEDQKSLNNIFTKSLEKNNNEQILFGDDDEIQELHDGQTIKKENNLDNSSITEKETEVKEDVKISLTKDVLPFIIPLSCFLTIKDNNKNFLEMLNMIKHNEELLEIFNEQTFIWWNKSDIIELINNLIKKYIRENSDIYNITIYIKMTIQSLIDKPIELLDFINERLKPKDIEKKKYGEVFTPIPLIEEMLDKLPIEVWSNPDLKWLDPANGMGNFMVVIYYRLMKGLRDIIPNEETCKKHILENMLYMSEINKKNCFISKQIFDINNNYKLNIYTGDSLTLDTLKEWDVEKFDIIVGNPPYQEFNATGDNKLYLSFIKKSLELLKINGLLLKITPSNVKDYLTCTDKNRDYIKNFYELLFISFNTADCYFKNIGIQFCYFLLKNNVVDKNITKIIFLRNKVIEEDIIEIHKGIKLPLCLSNLDFNIMNKVSNLIYQNHEIFDIKKGLYLKNNKLTYQRIRKEHIKKGDISINNTNDFQYKIIDKITIKNPYPGIVYYNKYKMEDYEKSKIIMCSGGYLMTSYDKNGEYNLSDNMIYLLCNNDNDNEYLSFKILTESNLVKYLNKLTMTDGLHGRDTVIMNLKKINLFGINNDKDVYDKYNLTNDEINIIEKTLNYNDKITDNESISSKSSTKSTKSSTNEIILCGAPLKKKGETCKNKANSECNGRCKRHFI